MAKGIDIDLEVVDAGVAYTLYSSALVNLAIQMNKGGDLTQGRDYVAKYSKKLHAALLSCGIVKNIPKEFAAPPEILELLQTQRLVTEINIHLVKEHSRRQESIFLFTTLFGGILLGKEGGAEAEATEATSLISSFSKDLNVPDRILRQCLKKKSLTPFRRFLHKQISKWYKKPEFWIGTAIALGSLAAALWQLIK